MAVCEVCQTSTGSLTLRQHTALIHTEHALPSASERIVRRAMSKGAQGQAFAPKTCECCGREFARSEPGARCWPCWSNHRDGRACSHG